MKFVFRLLIAGFGFVLFLLPVRALAFSIEVYDTIAGFETITKVTGAASQESFIIRVVFPDGSRSLFSASANASGEVRAEIPADKVRKAGLYRIELISKERNLVVGEKTFRVYPDSPNPEASGIYPDRQIASLNGKPVKIIIRLQDQYGNPVEGHEILLTSNRTADRIERINDVTNENGNVTFFVSSSAFGASALTAFDQTEKMTFAKRVMLQFQSFSSRAYGFASVISGVGGDPESETLGLSDLVAVNETNAFEVLDIKPEPTVNETVSFRVKAVDAQGGLITDYTKTIMFESTDSTAVLPEDYTFQPSDLGEHIFQLSLSFRAQGEQKLIVKEKDNEDAKGEAIVNVKPARTSAPAGGVSITKPTPGAYGNRVIDMEGNAPPNANVTIYDNGQQVGLTRASSIGLFTWTISDAVDGLHTVTVEANGILSPEVAVTVAASGAKVEEIRLTPNPAGPNAKVEVYLRSTPNLEAVSVVFSDLVVTLNPHPTDAGAYIGQITAPARSGRYPLDVQLTDRLGNEASYTEAETLIVDESLGITEPSFRVPSKVTGARAFSGPGRVTLSWEPSTDDTGIAYYKIYFGLDRNNLDQIAQTPDARTIWYIPNLEPNVEYFFQVVGVDTEGNEGHQRSAVVGSLADGGVGALPGGEYVTYPGSLPQDGPALWFAFGMSGLAGVLRNFLKRRKK